MTERTNRVATARSFRKSPTKAESALWQILRGRNLGGHKFRRQQPLGPFLADFYCPEARLVIELDGGSHAVQTDRDEARSRFMARSGNRVIRFWNNDVLNNLEGVAEAILLELRSRNTPSPQRGRGPG